MARRTTIPPKRSSVSSSSSTAILLTVSISFLIFPWSNSLILSTRNPLPSVSLRLDTGTDPSSVGPTPNDRRNSAAPVTPSGFLRRSFLLGSTAAAAAGSSSSSSAGSTPPPSPKGPAVTVAYRGTSVRIPPSDTAVPVAVWYPAPTSAASDTPPPPAVYDHRISLKKIGSLLIGKDFIPDFLTKEFALDPTYGNVVEGAEGDGGLEGSQRPLVVLCHGYLGSRFDLAHFGEALAREGYTCISPEFPESLASSYPPDPTLTRSTILAAVLARLRSPPLSLSPTSYGILGHSLGCGTALSTGDAAWTRVCVAGPAARRDGTDPGGALLSVLSLGDGLVGNDPARVEGMVPPSFVRLEEAALPKATEYPSRCALVFDRPDAPNHISFLSGGVNDSMVGYLSPLLPVAQALGIPVLDFDRYKVSRDSGRTGEVVVPLVCGFMGQFLV